MNGGVEIIEYHDQGRRGRRSPAKMEQICRRHPRWHHGWAHAIQTANWVGACRKVEVKI
jgi:hypothetical protein